LPHQTALRECFEETGIVVKAISVTLMPEGTTSQYLPTPFVVNLHWISQSNYEARQQSGILHKRITSSKWPKGCEQHLVYCYLVKADEIVPLQRQVSESDAIDWFTQDEVMHLETSEDIKKEISLAFSLYHNIITNKYF
jgi:8-oxo-dGTP pyrophosphatase MutT (NUDIX family)